MKRFMFTLAAALLMALTVSAQRLQNAREEAYFITDKMGVELGLTYNQRANVLQLNLGYLEGINGYRDVNGKLWSYRNKQMKMVLTHNQWVRYKETYYFYQPIGWRGNAYVHNIYAKYPNPSAGNYRPNMSSNRSQRPSGSHPHLQQKRPSKHFGNRR